MSSTNNENTKFIQVKRNVDFGFWELDFLNKRGFLRERTHIIPQGATIEDFTDKYSSILEYLDNFAGTRYIKEVVVDRKVVWATEPYCSWYSRTADKDDPNTIQYCLHPALVIKNDKLLCGKHADVTL